jgi:hypothetical protein
MNFDHRKPWIDHVCIQNWNVKRTAEWRGEWGKPIVNDELEYEGDISLAWETSPHRNSPIAFG